MAWPVWAPICVQHWGDDEFYTPNRAFGEYLCDNWSTKWAHFTALNSDVEALLNHLSTRQLLGLMEERY